MSFTDELRTTRDEVTSLSFMGIKGTFSQNGNYVWKNTIEFLSKQQTHSYEELCPSFHTYSMFPPPKGRLVANTID